MLTLLCCHCFFCCHFKSFKRSAYEWDLQMCACIHGFCFFYWFDYSSVKFGVDIFSLKAVVFPMNCLIIN